MYRKYMASSGHPQVSMVCASVREDSPRALNVEGIECIIARTDAQTI